MCTEYDGDADWVARAVRIIVASPILISCTAEQTTTLHSPSKLQQRAMHSYILYGMDVRSDGVNSPPKTHLNTTEYITFVCFDEESVKASY